MKKLWHITIDDRDWDYDRFTEALVWAKTAKQAEEIMRNEVRGSSPNGQLWIERPEWRLHVQPAASHGVALVHWHAG